MLKKIMAVTLVLLLFSCCIAEAAGENIAFSGEQNVGETFSVFGTGKAEIEYVTTKKGEKEMAVKTTGLGKNTWSSPCVDIFAIIKNDVEKNGAGRYAISFNVMLEGEEDKDYNLSLLVRSSEKTTLFTNGNGGEAGYRATLGRINAKTGQWKSFSTTFGVLKEDVEGEQSWKLCLDALPEDLHTVWLNDFSIIRFSDDTSVEVKNIVCVNCTKFSSANGENEEAVTASGENLLDEKTSGFENTEKWQDTKWTGFSAGTMSVSEEGYSGSALKMETPENTWGSPALDVFPYITEAGQYSISMFVKYDGESAKNLTLIIRGTRVNSFMESKGNNFYSIIGVKTLEAGKWKKFTATFTVTEEDIKEKDTWRLCFSTVETDIEALYIDEVSLVKGDIGELPENPEPDESVQLEQSEEKATVPLYDESTKTTAIKTAIITFSVTALVIFIKIFLPKILRKGAKK